MLLTSLDIQNVANASPENGVVALFGTVSGDAFPAHPRITQSLLKPAAEDDHIARVLGTFENSVPEAVVMKLAHRGEVRR